MSCEGGIEEFFRDRSVFVTGGTGFMGKVLVEKLLRSCSSLKTIFLLIRSRPGATAEARLKELKSSVLFDRVREECPESLSKLVSLEGDVTSPGLGLNPKDTDRILREVSVVFHAAATVKFNETLRFAARINLEGTKNLAELAKKIEKLVAFVHVSTAYSNCNRKVINEVIYPTSIKPMDFLELLRLADDETLKALSPELLNGHPNTYTFTKLLTENYLAEHCTDLPLTIVRPAIVTAAWAEPFPGWIDNKFGTTGTLIVIGKGILHTLLVNMDYPVEFLPVDIGVNHMIAAAWNVAAKNNVKRVSEIPILNGVSSPVNPLDRRRLSNISFNIVKVYPFGDPFRYPTCTFTTSRMVFNFLFFIQHYFPAAIADLYFILRGEKPCILHQYKRLRDALEEYSLLQLSENTYCCDNVLKLQESLADTDQKTFNLSVKDVNWSSYLENYALGIRRWVLRESDDTLPQARKNLRNLYYKTTIAQLSVGAAFCFCAWQYRTFQTIAAILL